MLRLILMIIGLTAACDPYCLVADESPPPSKLPADATKLLAKAEADIVVIRKALIAALTKSQAEATKKGDLDGALAVKARIAEIEKDLPAKAAPAPTIEQQLAGTYIKADGTVTIVLKPDMTYTNSYLSRAGKYTLRGNRLTLQGTPEFYLTVKDESTLIEDGGNMFVKR